MEPLTIVLFSFFQYYTFLYRGENYVEVMGVMKFYHPFRFKRYMYSLNVFCRCLKIDFCDQRFEWD